jgi:predicted DNA-binding protein YlxM (UPF0122 family)
MSVRSSLLTQQEMYLFDLKVREKSLSWSEIATRMNIHFRSNFFTGIKCKNSFERIRVRQESLSKEQSDLLDSLWRKPWAGVR